MIAMLGLVLKQEPFSHRPCGKTVITVVIEDPAKSVTTAPLVGAIPMPLSPPQQSSCPIHSRPAPVKSLPGCHRFQAVALQGESPMTAHAGMHINQASAHPLKNRLGFALSLRKTFQRLNFCLPVVENWPVRVAAQQPFQAIPAEGFFLHRQRKKRLVSRCQRIPSAFRAAAHAEKPVKKIVTGIRIGFDVIKKHPWSSGKFGQRSRSLQALRSSIALNPGLGHEILRHLHMLFAEALHPSGQMTRISCRQIGEPMDAKFEQNLPPFSTDPAHLTEMSLSCCNGVAGIPPAAE